jgi:hypothetical protein
MIVKEYNGLIEGDPGFYDTVYDFPLLSHFNLELYLQDIQV